MKHDITVEKFGIRLRPVTTDDAEFIYNLRRSPELSRYIGEIPEDYAMHQAWLERYFDRQGDYYFIIELASTKEPVGTISVYDIAAGVGNWGRWIIRQEIPAAPASAWLIFHVAFDILGLSSVYSNTVLANVHTVSFHERCGLPRTRIDRGGLTIRGTAYDVVIHTAHKEAWPDIQTKLEPAGKLAERWLGAR